MSDIDVFDLAIAEYTGPARPSLLSLSTKFGIPETTLRREIKRRGIVRGDASDRKRRLVQDHFAGEVAGEMANSEAAIAAEAERDIQDMNDGLTVCRKAIARLLAVVDTLACPRDIKALVEAAARAVEVIRRIRGLDAPTDFSDWSDEELQILAQTGRLPRGRQ